MPSRKGRRGTGRPPARRGPRAGPAPRRRTASANVTSSTGRFAVLSCSLELNSTPSVEVAIRARSSVPFPARSGLTSYSTFVLGTIAPASDAAFEPWPGLVAQVTVGLGPAAADGVHAGAVDRTVVGRGEGQLGASHRAVDARQLEAQEALHLLAERGAELVRGAVVVDRVHLLDPRVGDRGEGQCRDRLGDLDRQRVGVAEAAGVGDPDRHAAGAGTPEGRRRAGRCGVVERAVAVEVPLVGERVTRVGVRRVGAVEL